MIGALIAAWLDVRSAPLRTLAGIASLVIAVAVVMVVDAAAVLSQRANAEYVQSTFGRTATVMVSSPDGADLSRDDPDSTASFAAFLRANGVDRVTPILDFNGTLIRGDTRATTQAMWVGSDYPMVSVIGIDRASFPRDTAQSSTLHIVISSALATELGFTGEDAVGQVVLLRIGNEAIRDDLRVVTAQPVVIDAVSDQLGVGFADTGMLAVSDRYQTGIAEGRGMRWLVQVSPADIRLVEELASIYSRQHMDTGEPLSVARIDPGDQLLPLLDQQHVTANRVTVIALIVGGLGILGVGLATVRERSRDYGLRRAIGGSRRIIFVGVILQTLIETVVASVLALVIAFVLVTTFARDLVLESLPLPADAGLPVESIVTGIAGALAVGVLAAIIPAARAARSSVAVALHG